MSDSVEILSKLFDTLKDASDKNEQATQKLVEQQIVLVGKIKSMPMEDLKTALKEHSDRSENNMTTCNGIIELKTAEIMDLLRILLGKINKILIVFSLVVAITAGSYVIIRYLAEDHVDINVLRQELKKEREAEQIEILEKIQQQMEELHGMNDGVMQ